MIISHYGNFWQRVYRIAKAKRFPLRVMFELTYRCNFNCRHCYVPESYRKSQELKTEEVFSILRQLRDIGCLYLGFTGGEPFVRKDIMDILLYAKKQGFQLIIYTNGSLLNERIVQQLGDMSINKVDITIPAISKSAFGQITQSPESYRKVFNSIDLLHKAGINLGFKTCVLKENESEIKDIMSFCRSLGAMLRLDDMLLPRLNGSKAPYNYRSSRFTFSSFRSLDCANNTFKRDRRLLSTTYNLFKCGVGVSQAAITPQGELKMCLMIDYPEYKILNGKAAGRQVAKSALGFARDSLRSQSHKVSLKEAWDRLKELVDSIKPDGNYQCDKCKLYLYCKWCPARGWLENRNFTTCDSESRQWSEAKNRD